MANTSPVRYLYRQWPEAAEMLDLVTRESGTFKIPPGAWVRADLLTGVDNAIRNRFSAQPLKAKYLPIPDGDDQDGLPVILPPEKALPAPLVRHLGLTPPEAAQAPTAAVVGTRIALVARSRAQADEGIRNAHVPFIHVAVADDDASVADAIAHAFGLFGCDMVAVPDDAATPLPIGWLLHGEGVDMHTRYRRKGLDDVRLGVVITVYGRLDVAIPCIEAALSRSRVNTRFYIVDDCSPDPMVRDALFMFAEDGDAVVHRMATNSGYRVAANEGAAIAFEDGCDAVVFLNSDVLVTPGWDSAMLRAMLPTDDGAYPGADLVNLYCNDAATLSLLLAGHKIPHALCKPTGRGRSYLDIAAALRFLRPEYPHAVTSVGNCMLVTRKAWEAHGPFDAIYGRGYGEECELWARVVEAGGRAVVADDGFVFHESHATHGKAASAAESAGVALFKSRHGATYQRHSHHMADWPTKTARARMLIQAAKPTGLPVHFFAVDLGSYGGAYCLMRLVAELREYGINAQMGHLHEQTIALTPPYGTVRHKSEHTMQADFTRAAGFASGIMVASHWSTGKLVRAVCETNAGIIPLAFWQDREDLFTDAKGMKHLPADQIRTYVGIPHRVYNAPWVFESAVGPVTMPPAAGVDPKPLLRPDTDRSTTAWIPVGVDPNLFYPRPRQASPIRVLSMWRPETPRRGSKRLAEVFAILRREAPHLSLEVFGWGDGVPAGVVNHGRLPQRAVADLMGQCHVLLEPSDYQGFGLPGLEGLASGCEVVSTPTMGVDAYAPHRHLYVTRTHDPKEIAAAVVRASASPQGRWSGPEEPSAIRELAWPLIAARWVLYLRDLWAKHGTDAAYRRSLEIAAERAAERLAREKPLRQG